MGLDLKKVITQVRKIECDDASNQNDKRIDSTFELLKKTFTDNEALLKKLIETIHNQKASFNFATPALKDNENLETTYNSDNNFSLPHIVISTDGSQIIPSAHEISQAALINIGRIAIPYFNKDKENIKVLLTSEPTIYNSIDEIFESTLERRINTEDLISYERTLKETEDIVAIAKEYAKHNVPIIGMLDGTLIHWHIEKFPSQYIEKFIERFSKALYQLKELNIPVVSFISNSRSNDVINMLKIYNCPYDTVDCKIHCANLSTKDIPCNPCKDYIPVFDRNLVNKLFSQNNEAPGKRTVLFKSNSKVLNFYDEDLKIYFFYIYTGSEVARVEIPSYVANSNELLALAHNAITIQCKVGFGYPVTLSEAHLQAVITKKDREMFFNLIKNHLLKNSKKQIRLSSKELRKRVSYV